MFFKKGDKIVCVDDNNVKIINNVNNVSGIIQKGKIYTFSKYRDDGYDLYIDESEMSWRRDRFVLASDYVKEKEISIENMFLILGAEEEGGFFKSEEEALNWVDKNINVDTVGIVKYGDIKFFKKDV